MKKIYCQSNRPEKSEQTEPAGGEQGPDRGYEVPAIGNGKFRQAQQPRCFPYAVHNRTQPDTKKG